MTPEQQNKLEAIKASLRQHIEEAEKATPGPWYSIPNPEWKNAKYRLDTNPKAPWANFGQIAYIDGEFNAAFIAAARTMSPLACRIALAGIEALEETAIKDDINSHWWSTANIDLETIIFIWEREYDLF